MNCGMQFDLDYLVHKVRVVEKVLCCKFPASEMIDDACALKHIALQDLFLQYYHGLERRLASWLRRTYSVTRHVLHC